jgi:hypothetical protein
MLPCSGETSSSPPPPPPAAARSARRGFDPVAAATLPLLPPNGGPMTLTSNLRPETSTV